MKIQDRYYWEAKRLGYKSRASFKLLQINERFYILKKGYRVLDLGAAPGGWSQVAREIVGSNGTVVAVDIKPVKIENVIYLKKNVFDEDIIDVLKNYAPFHAVLSDMSPKISGVSSWDHARSIELAERSLEIAVEVLKDRGHFVTKIFRGDMENAFKRKCEKFFELVKPHKPRASSPKSSEIYIVCKRFRLSRTP
ncbi:MAG: RlmE family RNA methyltransferase [Thermoplasmata archaeon]|nr:RlmE family RNA methyltransferase [Thermoplasmata archaeon]